MQKEIKILFGVMAAGYAAMALSVFIPLSGGSVSSPVQPVGTNAKNIYDDGAYKEGAVENTKLNTCIAKVMREHRALAGRTFTALSLQSPDGYVMDVFRAVTGEGATLNGMAVSVYRDLDGPDTLQIENFANNPENLDDQGGVELYADKTNLTDPGTVKRNFGDVDPAVVSLLERQANDMQDRIMRCARQPAPAR